MDSQDSPWLDLDGLNYLREDTTFPLIIYFVPNHRANTQMSFCPGTLGLPNGSLKIPEIGIPMILEAHNFACKPLIQLR